MIEISSQMREFVNFAQDAVANNAKNTIARLGKRESSFATIPISAAADGDSVGKLRRSADSKRANNTVRTEFRNAIVKMFGGAVFALLDKDGNVDVNHFDARLAIFNDEWLKHESSGLIRPNLDSPGPAAVKALQAEFTRTARVKVGDWARKEIDAFFKANPDKIPAAIRNPSRRNWPRLPTRSPNGGRRSRRSARRPLRRRK